jgi:hypothetical protein
MECSSCVDTVTPRKDRPHTFLLHEPSTCGKCGGGVEARVVLREGTVVALKLCFERLAVDFVKNDFGMIQEYEERSSECQRR